MRLVVLAVGAHTPPKPLPPNASLKLRYELWLRDHHRWLLPMLDAIRSLTLFMPGRFQEGGHLKSECVYATLNLLSVWHDHLLDRPRALTAEIKLDPLGKQHAWLKFAQGVLLFFHYTEIVIEMSARRWLKDPDGEVAGRHSQRSWFAIAAVEAIKAYMRLTMLYANRGRMLVQPTGEELVLDLMARKRIKEKREMLQREQHEWQQEQKQYQARIEQEKKAIMPGESESSSSTSTTSSSLTCTPQYDPTNSTPSTVLPPRSSFSAHSLGPGHLAPLHIQNLLDLYVAHGRSSSADLPAGESVVLGRPHGRFVRPIPHPHDSPLYRPPIQHIVSEVLHIIRPVIYLLAKSAYAKETTDQWTPLIVSLAVDAASRALAPSLDSLSPSEFAEVSTRLRNYLFYLLRDPFFTKIMAGRLHRFASILNRLPLIGSFFSSMISIIFNIQQYHFYTSAS